MVKALIYHPGALPPLHLYRFVAVAVQAAVLCTARGEHAAVNLGLTVNGDG